MNRTPRSSRLVSFAFSALLAGLALGGATGCHGVAKGPVTPEPSPLVLGPVPTPSPLELPKPVFEQPVAPTPAPAPTLAGTWAGELPPLPSDASEVTLELDPAGTLRMLTEEGEVSGRYVVGARDIDLFYGNDLEDDQLCLAGLSSTDSGLEAEWGLWFGMGASGVCVSIDETSSLVRIDA